MAATIVRQRKLRTGEVGFTASTADSTDEYVVVVSERCDKEKVAELFIAYTPPGGSPNPIPKQSLKPLGGNYLICESISAGVYSSKTSLVFRVTVQWKEIDTSDPPQPNTSPMPSVDLTGSPTVKDPDDWDHTWSRRGHIVFVEKDQVKLFYKGGYNGAIHTQLSADPAQRKLFQASNGLPFKNPPPLRKLVYVWNFRWIKFSVPATLVAAEGKLNSEDFTIHKGGLDFVLPAHTALIDSVELSSYKWKSLDLVEISVDILHDSGGFYIEQLDQSIMAKDDGIVSGRVPYTIIRGNDNKSVTIPQRLGGNGELPADPEDEIYSTWSDYEEVDFADVALIEDLVA
jgi:hypothetical protein